MSDLQLSLITVNQTPLDLEGNSGRILTAIKLATAEAAATLPHVLCFPELSLTGYGCEDAFYMPYLIDGALTQIAQLARATAQIAPDTLIFIGLPFRENTLLYNCMAVLNQGRVVALIPKQHLAGEGLHYEPRWFRAFSDEEPRKLHLPNTALDGAWFGPVMLEYQGFRVGIEICEDAWVVQRPAIQQARASADLILNPAASHFGFGKYSIRRSIVEASSREYHCIYATVNLLGNEAGKAIYDGSSMIASDGRMLYESDRFSFQDARIIQAGLYLAAMRQKRNRLYSRKEEMTDNLPKIVRIEKTGSSRPGFGRDPSAHAADGNAGYILETVSGSRMQAAGDPDTSEAHRYEEFLSAVTLGLFDYMRKTSSHGYTVSLSGGADSAACALLVQRMIVRGRSELGAFFYEKAGLLKAQEDVSSLLHTIYQGTTQSSSITEEAAAAVAQELQSDHHAIAIQGLVDQSQTLIEGVLNRSLTWESDDITLQNIQARARSPLVWMVANATKSILIATGNRSESSVGYCTMDGDTSGGLAPIAGIDKAFLLRWLQHMETTGDAFGPVRSLSLINRQQPTAELRPLDRHQTDEKDLMSYTLLERIERLAFQDLQPPVRIIQELIREKNDGAAWLPAAAHFTDDDLRKAVDRFFSLFRASQWKRERLAVSFHLDTYNVDPRGYLRFPVLSGLIRDIKEPHG